MEESITYIFKELKWIFYKETFDFEHCLTFFFSYFFQSIQFLHFGTRFWNGVSKSIFGKSKNIITM